MPRGEALSFCFKLPYIKFQAFLPSHFREKIISKVSQNEVAKPVHDRRPRYETFPPPLALNFVQHMPRKKCTVAIFSGLPRPFSMPRGGVCAWAWTIIRAKVSGNSTEPVLRYSYLPHPSPGEAQSQGSVIVGGPWIHAQACVFWGPGHGKPQVGVLMGP